MVIYQFLILFCAFFVLHPSKFCLCFALCLYYVSLTLIECDISFKQPMDEMSDLSAIFTKP